MLMIVSSLKISCSFELSAVMMLSLSSTFSPSVATIFLEFRWIVALPLSAVIVATISAYIGVVIKKRVIKSSFIKFMLYPKMF